AVTEPIEVLYDGPRRFVAQVITHIHDWVQLGDELETVAEKALVDVIITIDFNKVKREVNLLKDVKLVAPKAVYDELPWEFFWGAEDGEIDHPPFDPTGHWPLVGFGYGLVDGNVVYDP
ncbi:MAG: hypothetical protein GTO54_01700, partial [Nitrososphaeria archaeon]|nr:hypothetical protein [Nitrososphaeria archaeon]